MPDIWKLMTDGFMPHGYCMRWDGPLLVVFIVGNLGIALAYFLIPIALRYFIGKRKELPYSYMFNLFAAFILSCGLTHIIKVWTLYQPVYWIEAAADLWTAAISLLTAALLLPLIPKALQLRSPSELIEANKRLQQQVEETQKAEKLAEVARQDLEIALAREVHARHQEQIIHILVSSVKDYAIFVLDLEGRVLTWNQGAQRINGYTSEEIIGQHFSIFSTPEAKNSKHPANELEIAKETGRYEEEGWRVRKDGTIFWAHVVITTLYGEGERLGFAKIARDLTERRNAEIACELAREEAEAARDAAIKADQLKSQFVANISHEIRTPLSCVVGMAELLTMEPEPEEAKELSRRLFNSSKQLLAVLNSLLDFSKLEAGKVQIEIDPFNLKELVDEVTGLVKQAANAKGLNVETSLDTELPQQLLGDENKIRNVLLNFAHNAVKFTEVGTIKVSVNIQEKQGENLIVRFAVVDAGIGVPSEAHDKLFQPFTQADGTTTRRFGGTGLGLSIAKQFVEVMGGQIGFESEEGHGSTFWFTVKLERVT